MRQTVTCPHCGSTEIREYWQLFEHEPVCRVLVEQASRLQEKFRAHQAELQRLTAQHYGLKPLPLP